MRGGPALLLDGATGTELERRGHPTGLPLWSTNALLDAPDALAAIHADYVRAGAEIVTAATFRTQRRTLARAGARGPMLAGRDADLCQLAVALARRASAEAAHPVWVAGSAPPLEDCYRPDRVAPDAELAREHARHAENLCAARADLILAETHNCIREAVAAGRAAADCGLPFVVSFVCWDGSNLLSGESLASALERMHALEPLAVGVNCLPPSAVDACLRVLQTSGLPFGVWANLGAPDEESGFRRSEDCSPLQLSDAVSRWVAAGARLVGGCCGTTPDHTRAMADQLRA
jgi:S-methylmethionine-dependent homocysteine/selenocysteine methylase